MEFNPRQDAEKVLATMARILAGENAAREVAIVSYGTGEFAESGYDNWDGGQTFYTLDIMLPSKLYDQVRVERTASEKNLLIAAEEVFQRFTSQFVRAVHLHVALNEGEDWRDKAKIWLSGEHLTNQGRVRSDNPAPLERDGLLFRSKPEIALYTALKARGVPLSPLPVFVKGGVEYQRIEVDLLIVKSGLLLVVEIDGDTYHNESPAQAHGRLAMLTSEGIHVYRIQAADCNDDEKANIQASIVLAYIEKLKASR